MCARKDLPPLFVFFNEIMDIRKEKRREGREKVDYVNPMGARRAKSDRKCDRRGGDGRDQQIRIGGNPHTDAG